MSRGFCRLEKSYATSTAYTSVRKLRPVNAAFPRARAPHETGNQICTRAYARETSRSQLVVNRYTAFHVCIHIHASQRASRELVFRKLVSLGNKKSARERRSCVARGFATSRSYSFIVNYHPSPRTSPCILSRFLSLIEILGGRRASRCIARHNRNANRENRLRAIAHADQLVNCKPRCAIRRCHLITLKAHYLTRLARKDDR